MKLVGPRAVSGMKLQDLESDQFALADLYGKRINIDADVSDEYVPSVSNLKRLTGRDPLQANLKYGKRFTFINQALPVFSGNTLPTVGERSRAFMARVVPVSFHIPVKDTKTRLSPTAGGRAAGNPESPHRGVASTEGTREVPAAPAHRLDRLRTARVERARFPARRLLVVEAWWRGLGAAPKG